MKKLLIVAFAALGFVACNNDDLNDVNKGLSGEVETSYISINLSSAEKLNRADVPAYQDGLTAERAVKSAYFFFFDANGKAFPVTAVAGNPATAPAVSGVNWISANLNDITNDETPNVSDVKDAVLVLSTYKGDRPSQIVAVINWVPQPGTAYDIEDLYDATDIKGVDDGFVMSNAVYSNGQDAIVGASIAAENICTNPDDALNNPVTIYVERIAAKVTVTADNVVDGRYEVKLPDTGVLVSGENTKVYVKVLGWNLHNDFTQSKLLKNIVATWDESVLGFVWNDKPYYRSYWANSLEFSHIAENNDFPETFPYALGDASRVNNGYYDIYDNDIYTYTYIGENTNYVVDNTDECTKVIIKAQLEQKNSEGEYEKLPLARWYTTYYKNLDDLLKAVANTIKWQYCYDVDNGHAYIAPEHLTVVKDGNMVKFQLSAEGEDKNWYLSNGLVAKTDAEMNVILGALEKATYYDDGATLYSVDIKHLGNGGVGGAAHKEGDYGVVRNHIYNLVLNSFAGFGSPVYVPNANLEYPDDPYNPDNQRDYVSAEVRVLSWRIVTQQVNVQP